MIEPACKNSIVVWQKSDEGVSEPALLIELYNDVFQLSQDGQRINLNYESIEDLCKAFRMAKKHNLKD